MDSFFLQIKERFGAACAEHEPLAKHLNMRIGGPARYFVEIKTEQDAIDAVRLAGEAHVPYVVLGGGSNMLVADEGYTGLVLKMSNRHLIIDGTRVVAEAGVISALVARRAAEAGLKGFAWAISLPGTMGGAVRGNAGCFGGEMKDTVTQVRVVREGGILDIPASDLRFAYRHSMFKDADCAGDIIWSVTMELTPGDRQEEMALLEKYLAGRKASQPLGASSAGCMFKNYEYTSDEDIAKITEHVAIPDPMRAMHRISAGWIIDQLGLKGLRVGDAQVSDTHGNFLLNNGHATAKDIADLVAHIKSQAQKSYGIDLHEEVQLVGFDA